MLDTDFLDELEFTSESKTESISDKENKNDSENKNILSMDKPLIYVGPNIFKLGIERYAIYRGELPPAVNEAIRRIPEISKMLIPVDELMSFTRNLLIPASPERKYAKIIQDKIKDL